MPNATSRRFALNIPLIVLWVVSIGVAVIGFWQLRAGNAGQADFYNTGGSDYLTYLDLQTQSTIGGLLLTAGIVGVFVTLAVHARNRAAAVVARDAAESALIAEFDEVDERDESDAAADESEDASTAPAVASAAAAAPEADATTEPVVDEPAADEPAAEASAAVTEAETPGPDAEPVDATEATEATDAEPRTDDAKPTR